MSFLKKLTAYPTYPYSHSALPFPGKEHVKQAILDGKLFIGGQEFAVLEAKFEYGPYNKYPTYMQSAAGMQKAHEVLMKGQHFTVHDTAYNDIYGNPAYNKYEMPKVEMRLMMTGYKVPRLHAICAQGHDLKVVDEVAIKPQHTVVQCGRCEGRWELPDYELKVHEQYEGKPLPVAE